MKKIGLIAFNLLILLELTAIADKKNDTTTDTNTTIKFSDIPEHTKIDKYGNSYYEREATITTKNFKVDNFWAKFSSNSENQSVYTNISRKGTFKVATETTSACTLDDTLDNEGCSGQKPFLLNNEALSNPMVGTTDEFEVAFIESPNYSNTAANAFYPLDVLRDDEYYKDPNPSASTSSNRGFFGFFTSSFDFVFSKTIGFGRDYFGNPDIADVEYDGRSDEAEDRRQRYIANIMAGIQRSQRLTMPIDGATATPINAPTLNTPVSLLHYAEAQKATESQQCSFMFLSLSSDGVMCSVMSGFGMNAWMPFFNQTQTTELQSSFIMADTENSLLAMAGKIEGVPYMNDISGSSDDKLSFLQNMLKPMKTMANTMITVLFGAGNEDFVSDPVERVYAFSEDEAMTLTFAVTNDGSQVDEFANFKLLRIRSVYGDSLNSCTVKKSFKWMMIKKKLWEETFVDGGSLSRDGMTSSEWVDWCQEATGSNGLFDYLFDWSSGAFFNPLNWMKGFFNLFLSFFPGIDLEITDMTNKVARGLILDIKKVDVDPYSPLNTRVIDTLKIENAQD